MREAEEAILRARQEEEARLAREADEREERERKRQEEADRKGERRGDGCLKQQQPLRAQLIHGEVLRCLPSSQLPWPRILLQAEGRAQEGHLVVCEEVAEAAQEGR